MIPLKEKMKQNFQNNHRYQKDRPENVKKMEGLSIPFINYSFRNLHVHADVQKQLFYNF